MIVPAKPLRALLTQTVLVGVALLWLGPYAWMTLTSLRTLPEIVAAPAYPLPSAIQFGAYREVLSAVPLARCLAITVAMALAIAALQIALALPAGYALAKLRFVGRKTAFGLTLACLLIPTQVTFLPVFTLLGSVGLVNSLAALILPFGASALGTFLVRQALLAVPDEIIEAARMDGASEAWIVFGVLGAHPSADPRVAVPFQLRVSLQRLLLAPRDDDGRPRANLAAGDRALA